MTCKCYFVFIFLFLQCVQSFSQQNQYNYSSPLDIPLSISGSFGELRTNSFHMGVDFKTMGSIGHNVHAIDDGYIVRIKVEPAGYGQALYINHPNGYTSVYAHLEKFSPAIEQYCREEQYRTKQFAIDLMLPPGKIMVKKGEIIAQSGNRGGSSGPHLHFEIRDTKSEAPISVLKVTNISITDTYSPVLDRVYVYPLKSNSLVNGRNLAYNFLPAGPRKGAKMITASGDIGIGIRSYDRTNGSVSKTGVYSTKMFVDDSLVFEQDMDKISYTEVRYVNSLMDYATFMKTGARINRLFLQPNNKLGVYKNVINHGFISFNDNSVKKIRIVLEDEYGNKDQYSFSIRGSKPLTQEIPLEKISAQGQLMSWKSLNVFMSGEVKQAPDVKLIIPKDALFDDLRFTFSKQPRLPGYYSQAYQLHNPYIPLFKPAVLSIKPMNLPAEMQSKALIVGVNDAGKVNWAGGEYKDGVVTDNIRTFGKYMVGIDTVAPEIRPAFKNVRNNDFAKWSQIAFYISDDLSGISTYNGYIDGKWVLFEYDPKNNLLFHQFDPQKIVFGTNHKLDLTVIDERGNKTEYHTEFYK